MADFGDIIIWCVYTYIGVMADFDDMIWCIYNLHQCNGWYWWYDMMRMYLHQCNGWYWWYDMMHIYLHQCNGWYWWYDMMRMYLHQCNGWYWWYDMMRMYLHQCNGWCCSSLWHASHEGVVSYSTQSPPRLKSKKWSVSLCYAFYFDARWLESI